MILRQVTLRLQVAQGKDGSIWVRPVIYNPGTINPDTLEWLPERTGSAIVYKDKKWYGPGQKGYTGATTPDGKPIEGMVRPEISPEKGMEMLSGWLLAAGQTAAQELARKTMTEVERGKILEDCDEEKDNRKN